MTAIFFVRAPGVRAFATGMYGAGMPCDGIASLSR